MGNGHAHTALGSECKEKTVHCKRLNQTKENSYGKKQKKKTKKETT